MNKIKFELYLRDKLSVLKQSEIDEIINEYLQHIDMRKADGVSEEDAIKDFGDLDELVDEILDAYKIDTSKDQFEDFSNTIKKWLSQAMNFINRITNSIINRSGKEIVNLIIEFILVILLMVVVSFAIDLLANTLMRIAYIMPFFLTRMIRFVVKIIATILNFTVSLSILYWFATERVVNYKNTTYTSNQEYKLKTQTKNKQDLKKDIYVPKPNSQQSDIVGANLKTDKINVVNKKSLDSSIDDTQAVKVLNAQIAREDLEIQAEDKSFSETLLKGNLFILKVVAIIFLIPMIVGAVGLGIVLVVLIYNTFKGYGSLGLSILLSGVALLYYSILILLINFVSGGKSK